MAIRVLIADDDPVTQLLLETDLRCWGYEPVIAFDGTQALALLQRDDAPSIAILDWMMPGLTGPEVCRKVRQLSPGASRYLVLLTSLDDPASVAEGLTAGADDYLAKPFDHRELKARIQVGERVMRLEQERRERILELEAALERVRVLQGLLPMCAWCRRVRGDEDGDYWQKLEQYIDAHTDVQFSHGICPECLPRLMGQDAPSHKVG